MKQLVIFTVLNILAFSEQVMFTLQPHTQKCLREELNKNVLVAGEFDIQEIHGQSVDIQVLDSNGHTLYNKNEATKGKFVFNTENDEMYEICFKSKVSPTTRGMQQEVSIKVKHGVEAKTYEALGEAAKLKPLELELKKLEDLSASVVHDFAEMRKREEEMRDTNESTNNRVLYFSLFSLLCLIGLATWQILYLRKFFKSKKLIE